jgi:hypothetical protein
MINARYRTWPLPFFKFHLRNTKGFINNLSRAAQNRLLTLESSYDLSCWPWLCTKTEYLGNLYMLDILDRFVPFAKTGGPALDVGSARWWYLPALKAFRPSHWTGVDLPAVQRAKRFDNWLAHAKFMTKAYSEADYRAECITEQKKKFSFITWFLPYLAIDPLLSAGLPEYHFDPAGLFRYVWGLLEADGILLIVNQGLPEARLQEQLFEFEKFYAKKLGLLDSPFKAFHYPRYGWVLFKSETNTSFGTLHY